GREGGCEAWGREGLHGLSLPFERRLAKPGQPCVGGESHEQVVAQPGVGQKSFELQNAHNGPNCFLLKYLFSGMRNATLGGSGSRRNERPADPSRGTAAAVC